jgi:hypothetical protein
MLLCYLSFPKTRKPLLNRAALLLNHPVLLPNQPVHRPNHPVLPPNRKERQNPNPNPNLAMLMLNKHRSLAPGLLLIVAGALLLAYQLELFDFRWQQVYPVLMLAIGAILFAFAIANKAKGQLFPGTILLLLGLFFALRNFDLFEFGYYFYDFRDFWPVLLIIFGIGFFVQFLFKPDDWGLMIPGAFLLFFGTVFLLKSFGYFFWYDLIDYWPAILIAIGLVIVIASLKKRRATE